MSIGRPSGDDGPPSPAEAAVLDAVDPAELVALLQQLIAVPSITGTAAESDAQHRYADWLEAAGLEVDRWSLDLPALRAHPDHPGEEAVRDEGWGVVGVLPAGAGGDPSGAAALVLQGHIDVVPPGDPSAWPSGGPFGARADAGTVYGRGACDMKAGLVANLGVALALRRTGTRLRRPLALHSVVGEEDGGLGALATLLRGHTGEACVITEPTTGALITANAGALTFRLEVTGRAAHGSVRYQGVSAVDAFRPVQDALAELERERNLDVDPLLADRPIAYPLSIGTVRAGDWASSVPDLLVAQGRYGIRLDEDPQEARRMLAERVAVACAADPWLRDHPVRLTWPGGQFASGRLAAGHPLLAQTRAAVATVTGAPAGRDRRAVRQRPAALPGRRRDPDAALRARRRAARARSGRAGAGGRAGGQLPVAGASGDPPLRAARVIHTGALPAGGGGPMSVPGRPPDGPAGEAELGRRLVAGDETALAALYDRYGAVVHGVALRVTSDRGGAEEVAQEVFAYAWRQASRFDAVRGSWQGWLATVAYRRAVDWVRAESSRRRHALLALPEPAASAEDAVVAADVARQVRRAVAALPEPHRECVLLAYYEGRTVKELAAALGVPEGTVKTRLRAARVRLADVLGTEGLVSSR